MTKREVYVFGWVYGRLAAALGDCYDRTGFKLGEAAKRPLSGFALIHNAAMEKHLIKDDLDRQIGNALDEIEIDNISDESPEPVLPLELQGSWNLGYYKGHSGAALPINGFSIEDARGKAGLSQQELAERLGVDQPLISRWERGIVRPSDDQFEKIKAALG